MKNLRDAPDAVALRQRASKLCAELIAAAHATGRVDKAASGALQRMTNLLELQRGLRDRSIFRAFALALGTAGVILTLSVIRRPMHKAVVDIVATRARVVLAGSELSTAALFAPSDWIEVTPANAIVPKTCTLPDPLLHFEGGIGFRIETADPSFPLSIGDTTPVPVGTIVTYQAPDSLTLSARLNSPIGASFLVGVPSGRLTARRTLTTGGTEDSGKCILDGDVLRVESQSFRFAPRELIGPLRISAAEGAVDFNELRAAGLHDYSVTTIRSGSIQFEALPGEHVDLRAGSQLAIRPDLEHPPESYFRPDKDGVHVVLHGSFELITESGRNLRPTLLQELWVWPWLRLIAAATLGVGGVLVSAATRLGIRL